MWIITDKQLKAISNSMRIEFERRACFAMTKEIDNLSEGEIKKIVHAQFDKMYLYGIGKEEAMMQFIRLSFEHPVLQEEILPEPLSEILLADEDSIAKIEKLSNQLKSK
jgi:hypothetical protein